MSEAAQAEGEVLPENDANAESEAEVRARPETDEAVEDSSTSEEKDTPEKESKPKAKGGFQKRIDELTHRLREAERREARLMDLVEKGVARPAAPSQPDPAPEPLKTLKDFEYDEAAYVRYVSAEAARHAEQTAQKLVDDRLSTWQEQQQQESNRRTFNSRAADFAKENSDYYQVVNEYTPISQPMAEAIQISDDGPAIAYYLGNNPEIAQSIYSLPPVQAAREIGKIEARIAYDRETAAKAKVSKAPEPAPKVDATTPGLRVKPTDPESDKLSTADWLKLRNKQLSS